MKKIYLVATIVAILTGFATYFFAVKIQESSTIKDVPKTDVVIALSDIPQYTPIDETMVGLQSIPTSYVVSGAVLTLEDVIGKVSLLPLVKGETVLSNRIVASGSGSSLVLSQELTAGEYAVTVAVGTENAVSDFIREGDYVNIYWDAGSGVRLQMEKVRVLKVSGYTENVEAQTKGTAVGGYSDMTFVLDKSQVAKLVTAKSLYSSSMEFVLVSIEEGAADTLNQIAQSDKLTTNTVPGGTVPGATVAATAP